MNIARSSKSKMHINTQRAIGAISCSLLAGASIAAIVSTVKKEAGSATSKPSTSQPNIVFIFTDDQDRVLQSLQYMGGVQKHLVWIFQRFICIKYEANVAQVSQGAEYLHHYCTVSLCCPSRVNLWTGRAAHNTNVTDIAPPYGMQSNPVAYRSY